jgi:hypothetical protein
MTSELVGYREVAEGGQLKAMPKRSELLRWSPSSDVISQEKVCPAERHCSSDGCESGCGLVPHSTARECSPKCTRAGASCWQTLGREDAGNLGSQIMTQTSKEHQGSAGVELN